MIKYEKDSIDTTTSIRNADTVEAKINRANFYLKNNEFELAVLGIIYCYYEINYAYFKLNLEDKNNKIRLKELHKDYKKLIYKSIHLNIPLKWRLNFFVFAVTPILYTYVKKLFKKS